MKAPRSGSSSEVTRSEQRRSSMGEKREGDSGEVRVLMERKINTLSGSRFRVDNTATNRRMY